MSKPFWWPDPRGWIAVSSFSLMVWVIGLSARFPVLMNHQLWVQLVTALAIGNGGLIVNFYFGSSKTTSEANDRTNKVLDLAATKDTSK